jgi:2-dehydro-3-deoxyphosphogluconate aldolase/(4S)-4-hydroxy-2-oxoglutarate aldolase
MPGAGTATEVINATDMGADLIKVFPAEVLGPAFIKAVKAPCPWTKLMASGGVTFDENNLRGWFDAGADCVAMGSNLFSKEIMQEGNYRLLTERIGWLLSTIKTVRTKQY